MLSRRTPRKPMSAEQRQHLAAKAREQHAKRRGFEIPEHLWTAYRREHNRGGGSGPSGHPTPQEIAARLGIAIPLLLLFVIPAAAHHAPSGWLYPPECCGEGDCFQIANPQEDVKWTPTGWLIAETNETIPFEQTRVSGDSHWHRCFYTQWEYKSGSNPVVKRMTRSANHKKCLYVPAPEN